MKKMFFCITVAVAFLAPSIKTAPVPLYPTILTSQEETSSQDIYKPYVSIKSSELGDIYGNINDAFHLISITVAAVRKLEGTVTALQQRIQDLEKKIK